MWRLTKGINCTVAVIHHNRYRHCSMVTAWCILKGFVTRIMHAKYQCSIINTPEDMSQVKQVEIYTLLLTFSLLLWKIPLCRPKMIPIPALRDISMWISFGVWLHFKSHKAHITSIHLWTILMISSQVLCHVVDLKHGFVTSWENVLFTLENIGTRVKITWNYFPCLILHEVKIFIDYAQGLVQLGQKKKYVCLLSHAEKN